MGYRTELHLAFYLAGDTDEAAYATLLHLMGQVPDPEVPWKFGWFKRHSASYHATCVAPTVDAVYECVQIGTHASARPETYLEIVRALSPCMASRPAHIGHIRGEDGEVWILFRNPVTGEIDVTKVEIPDYEWAAAP